MGTRFVDIRLRGAGWPGRPTLVALTVKANRNPRPRRVDLMIAATAAAQGLPLFTRNARDFKGLERGVEIIAV
jgi:predicted nucleic acid-binding protein